MTTRIVLICMILLSAGPYGTVSANTKPRFQLKAKATTNQSVILHWSIKPGYLLYKDRFQIELKQPKSGELGRVLWPKAHDTMTYPQGDLGIYRDKIAIELPIVLPADQSHIQLMAHFQGCAQSGTCYPPQTRLIKLNMAKDTQWVSAQTVRQQSHKTTQSKGDHQQGHLTSVLTQTSWLISLPIFYGFGLLLAFTPCVFPMIPILSSLIVGQKNASSRRALSLSILYVASMALTYAVAGVITAFIGQTLQSFMQTAWVIAPMSLLFVGLALAMFGYYEIRLPQRLEQALYHVSGNQAQGAYWGVCIMGALSALVVSPCVTPPLIGALGYIAHTGNALLGGFALFALGLGMGTPLILMGTTIGRFLPRSGAWLQRVKALFGFLLIAMAVWLLGRILPDWIVSLLWSGWVLICFIGYFRHDASTAKGQFVQALLLLLALGVGLTGIQRSRTFGLSQQAPSAYFQQVNSLEGLSSLIGQARGQNKYIMLDFYADWCTACQYMDRHIFSRQTLMGRLSDHFILARVDLTHQDAALNAIKQRFGIYGPPAIIFISPQGDALPDHRLVGEVDLDSLKRQIQAIQAKR